jgi:multidrug efflux pump subunit AcrB
MRKLIEFFARQGLFAELFTVLVIGIGIYSLVTIKREAFPNIQYDVITVYTPFPGAAPSEVEKLITTPLEQELREVDGLKKVSSTSIEGLSGIVIQLDPDQTNQLEAKMDIQEVIDRFDQLPDQAEEPRVTAIESKIFPIIEVAVRGGADSFALKEAARYVEDELEKIKGVARVDLRGEREYEIRIEISSAQLLKNQLSLMEVVNVLREQNVSIPGGTFSQLSGGIAKDVIVRTEGQFVDAEDVSQTVIRTNDLGRPLVLGDVAKVYMSLKKEQISHRVNGQEAIRLVVMKKASADAITMIDQIKDKVENGLNPERIQNIEFEYVNDLSLLIRRRLGVLSNNLLVGLILVVLILSLFLPVSVALVTAIGIPFAFLGTLSYFQVTDVSLNLITMMGLIIVLGMIVDDAVVVTENAVREMEEGHDPMTAAIRGTQSIWTAIFASVMTTVLAFFPMTIMSGIFGKFVSFIPLGVICALLMSLLECYFVLPYHVGRWVRLEHIKGPKNGLKHYFDIIWQRMANAYGDFLHWVTRNRYWMALAFVGLIAVTIVNLSLFMKVVLFPPEGIDQFLIKAKAPIGTTLEETTRLMVPLEQMVKDKLKPNELKNFVTTVGEFRQREDMPGERGSHYAQMMLYLTPENARERTAAEIIESLRADMSGAQSLEVFFERINPGPPVGAPISIGVRGENYDQIMKLVQEIMADLEQIPGAKDITHNFSQGKEQLVVRVDPKEARSVGLSAMTVGTTVMAALEGFVATSIRKLNDEIELRVSLPEKEKQGSDGVGSLSILNAMGQLIPLKSIATFSQEMGIESYSHVDNQRQVTISGEVDTDVISAMQVNQMVRDREAEYISRYPTLNLSFAGEDEDTQESLGSLKRAFLLALVLIYFLLILTFQSFVWPLIIILAIPIGAISVVWALFIHGQPLSFMGLLGVVALAGVIVNNAIVFVNFVMTARAGGANLRLSIIEAGQKRLRPIVLTTLTTACGILPTAYGIGGLDPFVVPIALALGWGMIIGSMISSLFIPAFIGIFDDLASLPGRWRKNEL